MKYLSSRPARSCVPITGNQGGWWVAETRDCPAVVSETFFIQVALISTMPPCPATRILLFLFLIPWSLVITAPALPVPGNVQVNPSDGCFVEGETVNASTIIEIVPSAATTFSETHTLTLGTDLQDARWLVVVRVDGREAAIIPREGSRVFVNGFLLSYPTTRDVELRVHLTGSVPSLPVGSSIIVLRWAELNARDQVVTGSEYIVNRTVSAIPPHKSIPETEQTTIPVAFPSQAAVSWLPVFALFGILVLLTGAWKRK